MDNWHVKNYFFSIGVIIAVICIIQPVFAQNGTMTISYRGSGGYYIGDTIVFDGRNTIGNNTLLKITGPNLPTSGVPVYDLGGAPGSGNTVPGDTEGTWRFAWSSANTKGIDKLVTARYTVTAFDLANPMQTASTSFFLKKPEFYINPQTGPVQQGDYIQLSGVAEKGVTNVKIDITDSTGKILYTHTAPVSADGFFNYEFRGNMQPGQYFVSAGNPSMKDILKSTITVAIPAAVVPTVTPSLISTPSENGTVTTTISPTLTQKITPSTSAASMSPVTVIAGLVFIGIIAIFWSNCQRKQ
jgi:hypothetical protein